MNRLKELRESLGFSKQKDFAKELDMPPNTYNNYEKGIREPNSYFWIMLAETYQVSIDWLMGLSDDPHRVKFAGLSEIEKKYRALDEHGKKVVDLVMTAEGERVQADKWQQDNVIDFGLIRHYFYSPAAGPDGLIENAGFEDIPRTAAMPSEADFCLTVNGDSMNPFIEDGQMIFVQEDAPVAANEIGVFFFQGGTYVKQFKPQSNGGVLLASTNPERQYANVMISPDSLPWLVCYGKVIGLERNPKHGRL